MGSLLNVIHSGLSNVNATRDLIRSEERRERQNLLKFLLSDMFTRRTWRCKLCELCLGRRRNSRMCKRCELRKELKSF